MAELLMRTDLAAFLREAARAPFQWGEHDCATFIADWAARARGSDPAAGVRGTYATEAEAAAVAGRFGLPRIVWRLARRAGLSRTRAPKAGAIGVCLFYGSETPMCGICTGRGWVVRQNFGLVRVPARRVICAFEV